MAGPDPELVGRVLKGDKEAFALLVERHRERAFAAVLRMARDRDVAEEAIQEATYQAFFGLADLRSPSKFGAWFIGIALNLARMELRRASRFASALSQAALEDGFENALLAAEVRQRVQEAIDQLAPRLAEAVRLHYLEGLSYVEASAVSGASEAALRVAGHRARSELRRELADLRPATTMERKERKVIEVDVQDVRVLLPDNWQPSADDMFRIPASVACVVLKERSAERAVVLFIGAAEGEQLALHLAGLSVPRPLTYTLFVDVFTKAGVTAESVTITDLTRDTFLASVAIRAGRRRFEVDARPSDAINLALRMNAPILVADKVMERVRSALEKQEEPGLTRRIPLEPGKPPEIPSGVPIVAKAGYSWQSAVEAVRRRHEAVQAHQAQREKEAGTSKT